MFRQIVPIILLTISNIFMTFAWYGHLKYKNAALWLVILVSWGIAFLNTAFRFRLTESDTDIMMPHI